MLKLVLIALEILKQIQQSRGTIKVSLTIDTGNMDSTLFERLRDGPDRVVLLA